MSPVVVGSSKRKRETDAEYACARLRGMRAHLLGPSHYQRLIDAPDVQATVRELMDTGYGPDLEANVVHGRTAAVVDEALKQNMVRTYRKVLSFLDSSAQALLSTLLGRWDVFNIKTILRAAQNHVPFEEVKASLFPTGYLGATELEALARLDDVRAVVDTMAIWQLPYAAALRRMYPEYAADNDLTLLELALDLQYAEWASSRLAGEKADVAAARQILGTQVDTMNLVTVFRMIKEDVPANQSEHYFLQGGRAIRSELFCELARMSDVDEVLDRLRNTPYGGVLDGAAVRYLEKQSIAVFERALEDTLMRHALRAGIRDPHGVGLAIAYLWSKQNEVTNVRIIIKGKDVGMPAERVRSELILV